MKCLNNLHIMLKNLQLAKITTISCRQQKIDKKVGRYFYVRVKNLQIRKWSHQLISSVFLQLGNNFSTIRTKSYMQTCSQIDSILEFMVFIQRQNLKDQFWSVIPEIRHTLIFQWSHVNNFFCLLENWMKWKTACHGWSSLLG